MISQNILADLKGSKNTMTFPVLLNKTQGLLDRRKSLQDERVCRSAYIKSLLSKICFNFTLSFCVLFKCEANMVKSLKSLYGVGFVSNFYSV